MSEYYSADRLSVIHSISLSVTIRVIRGKNALKDSPFNHKHPTEKGGAICLAMPWRQIHRALIIEEKRKWERSHTYENEG
jgi:hypothetical protein